MKSMFFERLLKNVEERPNALALSDSIEPTGVSYAQLDDISGRIANYLTQKHIGPEDFVMIDLPRSWQISAACIGVWRAGAAFVVCENPNPQADFIYEDCHCKFRFTLERYQEALQCDYQPGYVETDLHNAAYAIYTSGTTANPKGVLQEYGQIVTALCNSNNYKGKAMYRPTDIVSFIGPLSTVAAIIILVVTLYIGGEYNIVPYLYVKNLDKYREYADRKQINVTFLPPSLAARMTELPKSIHTIVVSSEEVKNIYFDKINLYNEYCQSEIGTVGARFKIDKAYPLTPIGTTQGDTPALLVLDENGQKCPPLTAGELCVENPYFRGYINLPQETEKAFRGGIYHTGDMGKYLPDGNIVYLGRADDMVKINGNRVEPAAIEEVAKEALGVRWAAAKAVTSYDKTYIGVYYIEKPQVDLASAKKIIADRLPDYMRPSFYRQIDKIPYNGSGKLVRNKLPDPEFSEIKNAYIAPQTEMEERMVSVLEKVLNTAPIGVKDDVFKLGMNSVSAILTITELGIPALTTADIYQYKTARALAAVCAERKENSADEDEPMVQPLMGAQEFFRYFDQDIADSTAFNVPLLYKLNPKVDLIKLKESITKVISSHQVFQMVFRNHSGAYTQEYTGQIAEPEIVEMTEKEFASARVKLVQPFEFYNHLLYRIRIIKTQKSAYLFVDIHHAIVDGVSMKLLLAEVWKAYNGQPIARDNYFTFVKKQIDIEKSPAYEADKQYYLQKITDEGRIYAPLYDYDDKGCNISYLEREVKISERDLEKIRQYYQLSPTEYFCLCYMIALSRTTGESRVGLQMVVDGRTSLEAQNIIGTLIRTYHVNVDVEPTDSYEELSRKMRAEMSEVNLHTRFTCDAATDVVYRTADVIYQDKMYDFAEYRGLLAAELELPDSGINGDTDIEFEILNWKDSIEFELWYNSSRYAKKTICRLFKEYIHVCRDMIHHIPKGQSKR